MASYQPVSFQSPGFDYGADISQIERRRAMAQMLQQQGTQPIQEQPTGAGQFAVPISPFQGAAKLGQILAASRQQSKADQQQRELAQTSQSNLASVLMNAQKAAAGTPGSALSEDASGNVTPAQAAVPGDISKAAGIYMQDPRTMQMGQGMMQQEIQQRQMAETIRKAMEQARQGQAGPPSPAYGSPDFQPSAAAGGSAAPTAPQGQQGGSGIPAGVDPLAWGLASAKGDLGTLAKMTQDARIEANKPVINRGFGLGTMQNGRYVPDQASLDQAMAMERGKQGISAQYAAPHTIPTSGGQNVTLFPSEQPAFMAGQMPSRLGGQAPQGTPQGGVGGFRVPGAPGLGTIGVSQSQGDIINQARQQAGGKAVDEQFAKDYVQFTQGGAQDATKQLAQLQDVSKALKTPGANLTGPSLGNIPDAAKNFINPKSVAMRERVEEVVQRSLRAVLGAQFTEKEGERLIARAYNPRLSESENAIRVDRLFTQLNQAFQQKQSAAKFFERNGTLEGWRGKLPSLSDFDPDAGGAGGADPLGIRSK